MDYRRIIPTGGAKDMARKSLVLYASRIALGYIRILRSTGIVIAGASAIALVSIVIVTPLWFLATQHTSIYTIAFLSSILIAGLGFTVYRLASDRRARVRFLRRVVQVAGLSVVLALLYLTVYLYSHAVFAAAIPLTIVFIAVVGLLLYGKNTSRR